MSCERVERSTRRAAAAHTTARRLALGWALLSAACSRCETPGSNARCVEGGIVHTAARRLEHAGRSLDVQAELTTAGCDTAVAPPAKAPPGAPCTHYSVCSAERCACSEGKAAYWARACVDGRCAGEHDACAIGAAAVGRSPCP